MQPLADSFGRTFPYLRLSLTEACNFYCSYCLPDGWRPNGVQRFLGIDEIRRLLVAFSELGMVKLRLTGGEPSLRKDLTDIIRMATTLPGMERVSLTTNGCLLPHWIGGWRDAGLNAINVSLDSLDPERFKVITGHDRHAEVTEGIEKALTLGFDDVKVNVVLLRDINDHELPDWIEWVRERDLTVRFIELMRTGDNGDYFRRHHVRAVTFQQLLEDSGWIRKPRSYSAGPAIEYTHPDMRGRIGFIAPYSPDFCASCNRLRVTAKGDLRLCLFGNYGVPLRHLLQKDSDHDELVARIRDQLQYKAKGHGLHEGKYGMTQHLAAIGG